MNQGNTALLALLNAQSMGVQQMSRTVQQAQANLSSVLQQPIAQAKPLVPLPPPPGAQGSGLPPFPPPPFAGGQTPPVEETIEQSEVVTDEPTGLEAGTGWSEGSSGMFQGQDRGGPLGETDDYRPLTEGRRSFYGSKRGGAGFTEDPEQWESPGKVRKTTFF